MAKKGPNEVISCLDRYFSQLDDGVEVLNLYSDGCGGQYNIMMHVCSLVKTGRFGHIIIKHTFPIRKRSFLPCNRDFGLEEILKDEQNVFTYLIVTRRNGKRRNPMVALSGQVQKDSQECEKALNHRLWRL